MEHSFYHFLRILSGRNRPLMSALRQRSISRFLSAQANFICDDWTVAAREDRRLLGRRAP